MTAVDLFDCRPLSARISPKSCEANKKRGVLACSRCNGLEGVGVSVSAVVRPKEKPRGKRSNTLPVSRRGAIRLTFTGKQAEVVRAMQSLALDEGSGPLEELLVDAMMLQLREAGRPW